MFAASSSLLVWLADSYRTALQSLARVDRERRLLMEEMRHRSRNSLTVTQTIIASTFKCSPEMMATVMGRLRAVLSSEALLLDAAQAGEQLRDIVNSELLAFGQDRYEAVGSEVVLTARHARSWALIVHELATNSAKHGALREAEGKVLVTWFLKQDFLDFEWREVGASLSSGASASPGFGTKLIDAMVKSVGGEISRQFENDGLRIKILVPVENLTTRHDQGEKVQEPPTAKLQPILH
jgi:two-component sensor histidine kinase